MIHMMLITAVKANYRMSGWGLFTNYKGNLRIREVEEWVGMPTKLFSLGDI